MPKSERKKITDQNLFYSRLELLSVSVVWALLFINTKIALRYFSPNLLAFCRVAIAGLFFIPLIIHYHQPMVKRSDILLIVACGLFGMALNIILQNQGLKYTGATEGGILSALTPVFLLLLAWQWLHEKVRPKQFLGLALAFGGIVLLMTGGNLSVLKLNRLRLLGDLLLIISSFSWALYGLISKWLLQRYSPLTIIAYITWASTIFLIPPLFLERPLNWRQIDLNGWLNLFYLGAVASGLAYLLWNHALSRVRAAVAGSYLYLIPLLSTIFATSFLEEEPGMATLAGGILVVLGAYLSGK